MKKNLKINLIWLALIVIVALAIDFFIAQGVITQVYERTLITIFINIILAVGLNLVIGTAGQFSLGHAGFMAIGAYAGAIISMQFDGVAGLFIGMLVGALLSGLVALVIGIPTLRLTGDYLAIATLGTSEIIRILILTSDSITNGAIGINGIPDTATWSIIFACVVLTTVVTLNYMRSSAGRATLAIRENEIAAEAMGVNSLKYKVIAFVIGAMTASVAGTLHASYLGAIAPKDFSFQRSIDILIIVVFGGIGSVTGSIIAAIALGVLNTLLQPVGEWRTIIYAIALVLVMIFRPSGLLGRKEFAISTFFKKNKGGN